MIDWNKYNPGQKFELKIVEEGKTYVVKTNLDEYEWAPNRTPLLAIISILENSEDGKLLSGDIIKLPIITDDKSAHPVLIFTHAKDNSCREVEINAIVSLN